MLIYLSQYATTLALCSGNYSIFFAGLQMIFMYAVEKKDFILAQWAADNLSNSSYADERVIGLLNKKMGNFKQVSKLKIDIEKEWYSFFWQDYELCLNLSNYAQLEDDNKDLINTAITICKKDKIAHGELTEILNETNDDTLNFMKDLF